LKCEDVKDNITECMDGLLSPVEQQTLDRHLAGCESCRALIESARQDREALTNLAPVPVPPELRQLVMGRLQSEKKKTKKQSAWKFFLPRLAPVAAALLITVTGINTVPGLLMAKNNRMLLQSSPMPQATMEAAPDEPPALDSTERDKVLASATVEPPNTIANAADETLSFTVTAEVPRVIPFWVKTSAGGTAVFVLWGGIVYYWYKRDGKA
jgi:anti-sigma factor RsiW